MLASLIAAALVAAPPPLLDREGRAIHPEVWLPAPAGSRSTAEESVQGTRGGGWGFMPYRQIETGEFAKSVLVADFIVGGKAEVVLSAGTSPVSVSLYRADPKRVLAPVFSRPLPINSHRHSLAAGVFDWDGTLDLALGFNGGLAVMQGSGVESTLFVEPALYAGPAVEVAAVFNRKGGLGDGLATTTWSSQGHVYLPSQRGLQRSAWPVSVGGNNSIGSGDIDRDGLIDVVTGSGQSSGPGIRVHRNTGLGSLTEIALLLGTCPGDSFNAVRGVAIGDVDGDGLADAVAVAGGNRPRSCLQVFKGNGKGGFAAPIYLPSYDIPGAVAVADVNGDGRGDVLTLHNGWGQLGVYLQQANGTLDAEQLFFIPYASWYSSHGLAIGDVAGDACLDAVIAGYDHGLILLEGQGCVGASRSTD